MVFGKTKLEFKLGIFVFVGIAILVLFVLSIGKFRTLASGYRINFIFNFVNGVKLGAPVRFAGVDVGEVKKIDFIFDSTEAKTKIKIDCWIKNKIKIPVDSTIWVNTLGLLGEKYIEIIPSKDYGKYLVANQALVGQDPMPMHEVTELAKSIAKNVDEGLKGLNNKEGTLGRLIYDDTVYKNLEAFTEDIKKHPWKLFIKGKEKPQKK